MAIPETMQAVEITEPGPPDVLVAGERPVPTPQPTEVLIKVQAAGVNRPDVMQRTGMYPPPPGASDIPGLEIAGTVVALGADVTHLSVGLSVGDNVCALVTGGGYAQYCTAPAAICLPLPAGYDFTQAAALPETFFTVWTNVFDRGGLQAGEKFLVHGGTSGIGTTAIQLAKAFGATVFTTAGNDVKCARCMELGADVAVNYKDDDFVERVKSETDGKGVNLILDMVGGDYLPRNIKCLAPQGRLVQIALQRGAKGELSLVDVMLKRLTVTGSTLRARGVDEKKIIADALRDKVWPSLESGKVKPIIHATFPLTEAALAHELMESSQHIGKIVLTV